MILYVLDTDTFSLVRKGNTTVLQRCSAHPPDAVGITVITVEEQLSGWYACLRRTTKHDELARIYQEMTDTVIKLSTLGVLSFTEPAIRRYERLKTLRLNVAKQDLRIAAIALENNCTLVTRNARDFQRVPGLVIEDWAV